MVTTESEITDITQSSLFNENNDENYYHIVANEVDTKKSVVIHVNNAKPYYYYLAQPVSLINLDRLEEGAPSHINLPENILQDHNIRLPEYYNDLYNNTTDYIPPHREQVVINRGCCDGCCASRDCNKKCLEYAFLKTIMVLVSSVIMIIFIIIVAVLAW
jgi:hypothetical protein